MKLLRPIAPMILALAISPASHAVAADSAAAEASTTVLDLNDVRKNPGNYQWFDFKPNLKKLILSGAADTQHVSILWYTIANGSVGLHYHAKTESVYTIDGSQADVKGVYPTGSLYFNPPGSGHAIKDSSGFFVLAYASPPDFGKTALIGEYTPVQIDTNAPDFEKKYPFKEKEPGVRIYAVPLDPQGGMSSEFIDLSAHPYEYKGNYLLVTKGNCIIDGKAYGKGMLVVAKAVKPQPFRIAAAKDGACLALGVSF